MKFYKTRFLIILAVIFVIIFSAITLPVLSNSTVLESLKDIGRVSSIESAD